MGGATSRVARRFAATVAVLALATSACSSGDDDEAKAATTTTASRSAGAEAVGHACDQGATTDDVTTVPVPGVASDLTMTSFDGTKIRMHWFPADDVSESKPAPTILMGPGWSLAGSTEDTETVLFGALDISGLNKRGYNVLTWDPRGFGESGGKASVNDPEREGHDAQLLLDWVAGQPEALTDDEGDPRVGMVGFSYGGGIQLTLAGLDCRVDAIVPGIAWNSLKTSLYKTEIVKAGWAGMLSTAAASGTVDAHVTSANESGTATGTLNDEDRDWFEAKGPDRLVGEIDVPTLLIQGTVDTLFTPDEAITNYGILHANKVPVKMLWFCGGHGVCLTDPGDETRVAQASFAWLDRYVKGTTSLDTGPGLDIIDQDGTRWTGDTWPPKAGTPLTGEGQGALDLIAEGGSGGVALKADQVGILGGLVRDITPSRATNAVELTIDAAADTLVLGAPELTVTYQGTVADGDRPMRIFAQLVDDERGVVVGNQITPIPVTLDGASHTVTVPLEAVAQHLDAGESVTLQIVATTGAYAVPRLGGSIDLTTIALSLPTTSALTAG